MRLRELREAKGISGSELARRIDVPQTTYSSWEREAVPLSVRKACDICDVLGVTLDELAGREQRADGTWHTIEDNYVRMNDIGRELLAYQSTLIALDPQNTSAKSSRADSSA